MLIVYGCADYEEEIYEIYEELGESEKALLFEADGSYQDDELFIKSNENKNASKIFIILEEENWRRECAVRIVEEY